jgi:hypothetical protein
MKDNYEELFSVLNTPEPPVGLTEKVLLHIGRHERRILMTKIGASAIAFCVSVGVAIEGSINLVATLSHSGSFEIMSLMFSDFSSIASNFPDFTFSLTESFPVFTLALLLSGILFAIWSMAALIDEMSHMQSGIFKMANK